MVHSEVHVDPMLLHQSEGLLVLKASEEGRRGGGEERRGERRRGGEKGGEEGRRGKEERCHRRGENRRIQAPWAIPP